MKEVNTDEYGYGSLIDTFEVEVLAEAHDNDYQGDSFYLLKNGDQYGVLIFGWGSCGGCDAYEAAEGNVRELTELRDGLWNSVVWDTREGTLKNIVTKDDKLTWYGNDRTYKTFKTSAIETLS